MDEEGGVRAGAAWEPSEETLVSASAGSCQIRMGPMTHHIFYLFPRGLGNLNFYNSAVPEI